MKIKHLLTLLLTMATLPALAQGSGIKGKVVSRGDRAAIERMALYRAFLAPKEELVLSYAAGDARGAALRKSPLLLRLEQQGKVTVERRPSPKGPSRKYYIVTEEGRKALLEFRQDWYQLCQLVEKIFKEEPYE